MTIDNAAIRKVSLLKSHLEGKIKITDSLLESLDVTGNEIFDSAEFSYSIIRSELNFSFNIFKKDLKIVGANIRRIDTLSNEFQHEFLVRPNDRDLGRPGSLKALRIRVTKFY